MSIPQSGESVIEKYSQLVDFFEKGSKPERLWAIGTEHEKFGFIKSSNQPLPYEGKCSIVAILKGLQKNFNWTPILEKNNLIGLTKNGANISLEPGGQLELSGAPLATIHETCDEASEHLKQVRTVAENVGAGFLGLGAAPTWLHNQMPNMPKGRYALMKEYMTKVGKYGLHMMYRTCTIQVNLDFSSESDMIKKFRVALALQPIATALFANSPFFERELLNYESWRARIWRDLDPQRTGMLPFVFDDDMSFQRYVDYALDVPMYFVYRNGNYIDASGQSFRDFLAGKLPALPHELPLVSDWADHLTTIFPEVRLKQFLEMRGADGGPWSSICALPALWVGLLYDSESLDAAWDLCKKWTAEQREGLRVAASVNGVNGRYEKLSLQNLATEVLELSAHGLKKRGKKSNDLSKQDEVHFLDILHKVALSGQTPADRLKNRYLNDWDKNIEKIFDLLSF